MKKPQEQKRVPYGKTLGQVLKENPDSITAKAWKTAPPSLPEQESLLDAFTESPSLPCPGLADLVTKWEVSADRAKVVYFSWVQAKRQLRKLELTKKRAPSEKHELLEFVRDEFWGAYGNCQTWQRLKYLADEIESIETNLDYKVTMDDIERILSGRLTFEKRPILKWLIEHWIKPVKASWAPLCICSVSTLEILVQKRKAVGLEWKYTDFKSGKVPGVQKIIEEAGLLPAKSGKHVTLSNFEKFFRKL